MLGWVIDNGRSIISGFRSPFACWFFQPPIPDMGRAAIAMAAVRPSVCAEPGKVTDHDHGRPPTDVMAITSLPQQKRGLTAP